MGRTYSFEPFLAQQPAQTYKGSGNEEHKIALSKEEEKAALAQPSTHYGQAHAETVKRYRSKAQARKRAPAKTAATAKASPAAKKVKPQARPAAAQRTAAPKRVVTKAPARKAEPAAAKAKAPARKKVAAVSAGVMGTLGRKVVARAAAAAKKTVARAVKTAKKATTRKPAKKR
jgi:hypothetical protein